MIKLTQELLRERLHYDPDTGIFIWKIIQRSTRIGKRAGGIWSSKKYSCRYRKINLYGRSYREHRLAYLYMTGEWPKDQVDHIDRDGENNIWSNLRQCDQLGNMKNLGKYKSNSSGLTGLSRCKRDNVWRSYVYVEGKLNMLYQGSDLFEACCRRLSEQTKLGFIN